MNTSTESSFAPSTSPLGGDSSALSGLTNTISSNISSMGAPFTGGKKCLSKKQKKSLKKLLKEIKKVEKKYKELKAKHQKTMKKI